MLNVTCDFTSIKINACTPQHPPRAINNIPFLRCSVAIYALGTLHTSRYFARTSSRAWRLNAAAHRHVRESRNDFSGSSWRSRERQSLYSRKLDLREGATEREKVRRENLYVGVRERRNDWSVQERERERKKAITAERDLRGRGIVLRARRGPVISADFFSFSFRRRGKRVFRLPLWLVDDYFSITGY